MQKEDLISVKDNGWTLVVENNNLFNNNIHLESIMTIEKKGGKKK